MTTSSTVHVPPTASRPALRLPSVGLTHFGIPLGIAGLAGAWAAAEAGVDATSIVGDVLWSIALVLWVLIGAAYVIRKLRGPETFGADLRHPIIGPFAAYAPIIGVLLMTHFGQYIPDAAPWIVWLLVTATVAVAAQLVAHWLVGDLSIDHLHPGYFLPVVAGAFVGSIGLSSVGQTRGAEAAFGIGIFFWLVIGTIVTGRLITRGPLPDAVKPTLAVLSVPPAVGGVAWLLLNGGDVDAIALAFAGISAVLIVVQLVLIREYRKLSASSAFWTFTFPIASTANFAIRWVTADATDGAAAAVWLILAISTAAIVGLVIYATLGATLRRRRIAQYE